MKKLFIILSFFICLITVLIFVKFNKTEVAIVKSKIDKNEYLVRNLPDKRKAANMLAKIKKNIFVLTNHLYKYKDTQYSEYEKYIRQLKDRIMGVDISESSEDSYYTSYSVNKGEQIVFCLRSKKERHKLHNINMVMYVALHELSHVACPEVGHTELFKKIFHFITKVAMNLGIYKKVDFARQPTEYCGLTVSESIV